MNASRKARDFAFARRNPGASCFGLLHGCGGWMLVAFIGSFLVWKLFGGGA